MFGLTPAASATAREAVAGPVAGSFSAPPPFCQKVRSCVVGGDTGWTWVHAAASSARKGRSVAARLVRNAKAVHERYGAPVGVSIYVIKKGACWSKYGRSERPPSRACTLKRVVKRF
ncbi:hypothetical protein [Nonomuraea sp. LPB2021202275-12-8]|uniref:hypothetical protein n=1 Tax=Nonomuraea sp. LPB2021202275-12-8 TaxID=3120159 RepID=UPI00300CECEA